MPERQSHLSPLLSGMQSEKSDPPRGEALARAAELGQAHLVLDLLATGHDPAQDDFKPLRLASIHGHLACVKALIPVSKLGPQKHHPLVIASSQGHAECAALLLDASRSHLDPCILAVRSAIINGREPCVEVFLSLLSSLPAQAAEISQFARGIGRPNIAAMIDASIERSVLEAGPGARSVKRAPTL